MAMRYLTPPGVLRRLATELPDAPALTEGDRTLTWAELYARARAMATALVAEGVGPGDRVAHYDRSSIAYFEVFFGAALLGAVSVAVNWRLNVSEVAAILDDAEARVVFVGPDYLGGVPALTEALTTPTRFAALGGADGYQGWLLERTGGTGSGSDPGFDPDPDDVVTQLYTSGTTGLPKGVMLTGRNLSCVLSEAEEIFHVGPDTVSLVAMPLFHIGGTGWALAGMSRGGHSVIARDLDPATVLALVERHRVTETFVVPALLMLLLGCPDLPGTDVSSLRCVFYGASPISDDVLVRSIRALRCDFSQVYGLTETTGAITALLPEDHDPDGPRSRLLRSAGKPFAHVALRIVDPDTGDDLPIGRVGEVWTRSDQNMAGYWRKPEETKAVLTDDGWFRTGDAGWMDAEGYLFLHDRIKDMIVTGAENVYPAEVENVLLAHPSIVDAAVIGVPDDRWGETVKAVVVTAAGETRPADELEAEVIAFARQRLAHFKCPTSVDVVDELPRNPSGKILKRQLREPYWRARGRSIN
ncbi:MAG: long-chain-fatty-acid--CoA ligase [Acidimicrobiales bacterium]